MVSQMQTAEQPDVEDLDGDVAIEDNLDDNAEPLIKPTIVDEDDDEEAEEEEEEKGLQQVLADKDEEKKAKKRKRSQNNCLNCKKPGHLKRECPQLSEERRAELQELVKLKVERKGHGTGRKKKRQNVTDKLEVVVEDKAQKKTTNDVPAANKNTYKKKRPLKDKTGQEVQEGEGLFQGFRVLKSDVERLRELHTKLQKQKVSAEEMKEVLKRERRRAEKNLANSKKNVCYQCRQPGHILADCPQGGGGKNKKDRNCFKCGSKDHSSKECQSKLKGADAYRFAKCFVCGQDGHLAKSCPDNPRGLYPKGGGCRFCGSVEHLKSECPRKSEKDARSAVCVSVQNKRSIEDEGDLQTKKKSKSGDQAKKSKKVSF